MQGWANCIGTHPENKLVSILRNAVFSTSDSLIESNYIITVLAEFATLEHIPLMHQELHRWPYNQHSTMVHVQIPPGWSAVALCCYSLHHTLSWQQLPHITPANNVGRHPDTKRTMAGIRERSVFKWDGSAHPSHLKITGLHLHGAISPAQTPGLIWKLQRAAISFAV